MQPLQARLETILDDSVKHHMLSDVEVGAFLSGGVDSGYLAAASGADQAFTVGFDEGNRYNEVEKAAQVAKAAGLRHHVKIISKENSGIPFQTSCTIWMNLQEMHPQLPFIFWHRKLRSM
mgnify:CR=1 FL=1